MITLTEAKDFLRITGSGFDAAISGFIGAVETEIETFCDRKLNYVTINNEVLKLETGWETNPVRVIDFADSYPQTQTKQYPVTSGSLSYENVVVDNSLYFIDGDTGVVTLYQTYDTTRNKLTITYGAGYTTMPNDLKNVALYGVKQMFRDYTVTTNDGGQDIKSKKIGDFSVTFEDSLAGSNSVNASEYSYLPKWMRQNLSILMRYKRKDI